MCGVRGRGAGHTGDSAGHASKASEELQQRQPRRWCQVKGCLWARGPPQHSRTPHLSCWLLALTRRERPPNDRCNVCQGRPAKNGLASLPEHCTFAAVESTLIYCPDLNFMRPDSTREDGRTCRMACGHRCSNGRNCCFKDCISRESSGSCYHRLVSRGITCSAVCPPARGRAGVASAAKQRRVRRVALLYRALRSALGAASAASLPLAPRRQTRVSQRYRAL